MRTWNLRCTEVGCKGRIKTKHEPQEGDLPILPSSDRCHVPAPHTIKVKKLYNRLNVYTYIPRHPPSQWKMMVQNSTWYADGTFKVVPILFHNGLMDGDVIPIVYIVMVDKSAINYTRLFNKLKEWKLSLAPLQIWTDFKNCMIS
ncbi:unnamed protein product [Lepeophtheirus salmonis]|uniref:(salmon louse) hypothetical protein n=1 Tax=Lepeophtheirus salmonis TaxID=72036 RepID=A0A817F954_LEPSM|nr:unnamed protein product [Lepeophtheirus salmonis]CAG9475242.1 unnamed protein product [Lepeophtheirus salmonis]